VDYVLVSDGINTASATICIGYDNPPPPATINGIPSILIRYPGQKYIVNWTSTMAPTPAFVTINYTAPNNGIICPETDALALHTIPILVELFDIPVIHSDIRLFNPNKVMIAYSIMPDIVVLPLPKLTLSCDKSIIYPGDVYTIRWISIVVGGGYALVDGMTNQRPTNDQNTYATLSSIAPGTSFTYTITLYASDNTLLTSESITVIITTKPTPTPVPAITITSDKLTVSAGGTYIISWTTTSLTRHVSIDNGYGTQPLSTKSITITAPTSANSTSYKYIGTLLSNGSQPSITASVTVVVLAASTFVIRSDRSTVSIGAAYTIGWRSTYDSVESYVRYKCTPIYPGDTIGNEIDVVIRFQSTDSIRQVAPVQPPLGQTTIPSGTRYTYQATLYDISDIPLATASVDVLYIIPVVTPSPSYTFVLLVDRHYVVPGSSVLCTWSSTYPSGTHVNMTSAPDYGKITANNTTSYTYVAGTLDLVPDGTQITLTAFLLDSGDNVIAIGTTIITVQSTPIPTTKPKISPIITLSTNIARASTNTDIFDIFSGDSVLLGWVTDVGDATTHTVFDTIGAYVILVINTTNSAHSPISSSHTYAIDNTMLVGTVYVVRAYLYDSTDVLVASSHTFTFTVRAIIVYSIALTTTLPALSSSTDTNIQYEASPGQLFRYYWTTPNIVNAYVLINDNVSKKWQKSLSAPYNIPTDAEIGSSIWLVARMYNGITDALLANSNTVQVIIVGKSTIEISSDLLTVNKDLSQSYTLTWITTYAPAGSYATVNGVMIDGSNALVTNGTYTITTSPTTPIGNITYVASLFNGTTNKIITASTIQCKVTIFATPPPPPVPLPDLMCAKVVPATNANHTNGGVLAGTYFKVYVAVRCRHVPKDSYLVSSAAPMLRTIIHCSTSAIDIAIGYKKAGKTQVCPIGNLVNPNAILTGEMPIGAAKGQLYGTTISLVTPTGQVLLSCVANGEVMSMGPPSASVYSSFAGLLSALPYHPDGGWYFENYLLGMDDYLADLSDFWWPTNLPG
jgi:hypothetical protein